ncbi:hypothetical protein HC024_10705 [Methylococcaceae bacterium WWC4]|uniref:hypothetical protein n=1 Tax=Methylomonas sp. LWB TaxID=1905845 RepID=UPI0008D8D9CF|nr:hypothetical protein [Methylomonas sp. LWB]NJA06185.1 hypothetical protein [Methylococcaceae bacterium WWC4]OHX34376.1 hypothetical protein BJL95_17030 [Methylomonas sp. LWB]
MNNASDFKKAHRLVEVDNALRFDVPLEPDHEFYTDFSDVRGDFEDRLLYKQLNVHPRSYVFNREANQGNKVILFLAGMRGSGKTSELARIAKNLHHPQGFFCVTCNLDVGLDMNDLEYMDVLIYQIERLIEDLERHKIKFDENIVEVLYGWFAQRVEEVNRAIKAETGFEIAIEAKTPNILGLLGITSKLKANLSGSKENAEKIRLSLKNNFTDFAFKFNEFIETVNLTLRQHNKAQEVMFIIDGLEKTATSDIRRKIVLEETNRIRAIRVHTIFTLPIELMSRQRLLEAFSTVTSFPFVKIREKNGDLVEKAIQRFETFVYKRIDPSLFDSPDTVRQAILYGGGSPRELLRVLEYANMFADEDSNRISRANLEKGIKKLAAQTSQYLSKDDLEKLKELDAANKAQIPVAYDESWQDLLEKLIILEYNDGTYKRVNPVIEESALYKHYVG